MKTTLSLLLLLATSITFACAPSVAERIIPDPVDGSDFRITSRTYSPRSKQPVPTVFILSPIVGETPIDRRLAAKICRSGMNGMILNVVKVTSPEEEIANLKVHDNSYIRALAGVRAVMDELENNPRNAPRYGILGLSLGGMLSAYVAGNEARILASVIVVGGGNVPGILAYSDQELVVAQRRARMEQLGLRSDVEYEAYLAGFVTLDPLQAVRLVRPGSMYFFIAENDTTVPTVFQKELRDAAPSPVVFSMGGGHLSGILKAGSIHSGKITKFLKQKLLI